MWDRQYISSVAVSAAVLVLALAGLVSLPLWLGWGGAVALVILAGGFVAWFYGGARPDLPPREHTEGGKQSDDE